MTKEEAIELLKSSKSPKDWDDNCNKVQAAFGGYPHWWQEILFSSWKADLMLEFIRQEQEQK